MFREAVFIFYGKEIIMRRFLGSILLVTCVVHASTAWGMTFTVSDEYDLSVTSPLPPTVGPDGVTIEGDVYHYASAPFVNGTTPAGAPFGLGWPAPAVKNVVGWEFRIDDPNSLDSFFVHPDAELDFAWSWTLFADDTSPNAGGVPSSFTINKTGKFSDFFPPGGWVPVKIDFAGSSIDAHALIGVHAPNTPGFFEIGFVVLAVESDLTPFFPPGVPDGLRAFITGGEGALRATTVIPEPLTPALAGIGMAALTLFGGSRRRRGLE